MSKRDHGYARYRLDGCRCYVCGFARAEYDDRRNLLIAAGRWHPFVPLEETQHLIEDLRAVGLGDRQIALLAGLNRKVVRDIRRGFRADPSRGNPPMTKVRSETAAAIRAIPFTGMLAADGATVDATLTWERVHALIRSGYPRTWIARHLGSTAKTPALQLASDRVSAANARAVRDLLHQVGPRLGPSARARREGELNGWPTVADLLDDEPGRKAPEGRPVRGGIVSAAQIAASVASAGGE